MDDPILNKGYEYHDPGDYNGNYDYDNNYNGSEYGSIFNTSPKAGYLMMGVILYISFCCFCKTHNERNTDLNVRLNQETDVNSRIVEKIKNNTVDPNILAKGSCCSICLDDFDETKDIVYLDCQHIYHTECIIEWINKDTSCPLCRTNSLV